MLVLLVIDTTAEKPVEGYTSFRDEEDFRSNEIAGLYPEDIDTLLNDGILYADKRSVMQLIKLESRNEGGE